MTDTDGEAEGGTCPACGTPAVPIRYGLATGDELDAVARGELVVAAGTPDGTEPLLACTSERCGYRFRDRGGRRLAVADLLAYLRRRFGEDADTAVRRIALTDDGYVVDASDAGRAALLLVDGRTGRFTEALPAGGGVIRPRDGFELGW